MRGQGRLIYDSAHVGVTVGARSGMTPDRALCFRSGDLTVDLVVHASGALQTIHGQVVHDETGLPIPCASVRVGDTERVPTDEHGQFVTSSLAGSDLQFLWIDTPESQVLCSIPPAA